MQNKKKTGGVRGVRVRVRVRGVRVRVARDRAGGECVILFEKHPPPPKKSGKIVKNKIT